MYLETPVDVAVGVVQSYRTWSYITGILIQGSQFSNNSVTCESCSGGGMAIEAGGAIALDHVTVANNCAALFGGGVLLGGPLANGAIASCALNVSGESVIADNIAVKGGSQLYHACGGPVTWRNSVVNMTSGSASDVVVVQSGSIVTGAGLLFQCPPSTRVVDQLGGLFGANAVGSYSVGTAGVVLSSSLQFGCVHCPDGFYALQSGSSNGSAGISNNVPCFPCPLGAVCSGGCIAAAGGYWGAGFPNLAFALCPQGHCAPPPQSGDSACVAVDVCSANRRGQLCGSCVSGYAEAIGSLDCVANHKCSSDKPVVWGLFVAGVLAASVALLVISDAWLPSTHTPTGYLKIFVYYLQMTSYVQMPLTTMSNRAFNVLLYVISIFRLQWPASGTGLCAIEGMNARLEAQLEGLTPLAVAVGIVVCLAVQRLCCPRLSSRQPMPARSALRACACALKTKSRYADSDSLVATAPVMQLIDVREPAATAYVLLPSATQSRNCAEEEDADSEMGEGLQDAEDHYVHNATAMTLRSRYIVVAINFILFSYAVFLSSVVMLLHCVTVPGHPNSVLFLFIEGDVKCAFGGWQAGYVVALVLLIALPLCLIGAAVWGMQATGATASVMDDLHMGLRRAVVGAYRVDCYWWESSLMLQRLALSLLYTFASSVPLVQVSLTVIFCAAFLVVHVFARPMRYPLAQLLQTVLLACLLIAAVLHSSTSVLLQFGLAVNVSDVHIASLESLTVVFGYVVPVVVYVCVELVSAWQRD